MVLWMGKAPSSLVEMGVSLRRNQKLAEEMDSCTDRFLSAPGSQKGAKEEVERCKWEAFYKV